MVPFKNTQTLEPDGFSELGIDPVISGIDNNVGFTRLYGSYISWRSATVPVAKEINPQLAFDRLFASSLTRSRTLLSCAGSRFAPPQRHE